MEWTIVLAGPARKSLDRIPTKDRRRILAALDEMQQNPFQGDIRRLQGLSGFRRRVGNWRIFRDHGATRARGGFGNRTPRFDHILNGIFWMQIWACH
jgi:mRNA-degrading endonuclease RelE of RelBE toxin-antitoxin system